MHVFLLSCQLDKSKLRHIHHSCPDRISAYIFCQILHKLMIMTFFLHVDEINHHNSGNITQSELPCNLLCRFDVNLQELLLRIFPLIDLPLLTSITVIASVGSITRYAPDFKYARFESVFSSRLASEYRSVSVYSSV